MEGINPGVEPDEFVAFIMEGPASAGGGGLIELLDVEAGARTVALVGEDGLEAM